jgi:hypothetical protein
MWEFRSKATSNSLPLKVFPSKRYNIQIERVTHYSHSFQDDKKSREDLLKEEIIASFKVEITAHSADDIWHYMEHGWPASETNCLQKEKNISWKGLDYGLGAFLSPSSFHLTTYSYALLIFVIMMMR